jgi:small-conductance mechanosensitive channel
MSQRADAGAEFKADERSELDEMRDALAGSVKRRLVLWAVRWALGFLAIAVAVYFYPTLTWLFWAGAGVAVASLAVTLSIYAFARRRLELAKRRLDDYERIAREAEEKAVVRGDAD